MARKTTPDDFSNSLTMLHSTLMHTGKELKDELTRGVETLRSTGEDHQRSTETAVVSELSKMRTDLRDARNRLMTNGVELSSEIHTLLETLQREMHGLKEALRHASTAPAASAPDVLNGAGGLAPSAAPGFCLPPEGDELGDRVTDPATTPSETLAPTAAAVVIPGPRPSSDAATAEPSHAATDAGIGEENGVPTGSDLAQAVREVLQEELSPLRQAVAELRGHVTAQQAERVALASRDQVAGLAAGLENLPPALTAAVAELRAELRETGARLEELLATPEPEPEPEPESELDEEQQRAEAAHADLLRQAARVSRARLVCHHDIWDFVVGQADHHPHFRTPQQLVTDKKDRVEARLSGRSLIAVLISLWTTRNTAPRGSGDWALATTLYDRVNHRLASLSDDGDHVTITLDDRTSDTAEPEDAPLDDTSVSARGGEDDKSGEAKPDDSPRPDTEEGGPEV